MTKSTSQVLQEARQLIEAGWCQGTGHIETGEGHQYCIIGAIDAASLGCLMAPLLEVLDRHLPRRGHSLSSFNDNALTTQRDVLALFDRALVEVAK